MHKAEDARQAPTRSRGNERGSAHEVHLHGEDAEEEITIGGHISTRRVRDGGTLG
jgi:hypothetical protein